jgi:ABC-2 type transport system permease protein
MRKALAVGRKEFRQIVRDRRTLMILLFIPVFFLLLYGYALNFDIRHVALAVEDRDGSAESRALVSAFLNSGYFDFAGSIRSSADLGRAMDGNVVRAALVIPEGTGRLVRRGQPAPVQVIINGDNANTAATVMGYAITIVRSISAGFIVEQRGLNLSPPIAIEPRIWFNPELRSTLFLVPGLIGFIGMITGTISTALSVVREKERGTWEQVRMAPINTVSYVVGKTLPYLGISLLSSMGIIVAAMALFDMPMRGAWGSLLLAAGLFLLGALGTGLFVSTVADSQLVAFQVTLILAFLPTFLLSGFIFPIQNMPRPIQIITYAVPARYFLVALRGIVLKGVGLATVWGHLAALTAYAVVVLGLASVRLSRERG